MWNIIIIVVALLIGALVIKNVGCGCGSPESKKKDSCCG